VQNHSRALEVKRKIDWGTFWRLMKYVTPYWELKAVLVLVVFTTVISVMSPAIIGNIIDMVRDISIGNQVLVRKGVDALIIELLGPVTQWVALYLDNDIAKSTLLVFSSSLVLIAFLDGLLNFLQRYILTIISQRASFDLRDDMYNSLLNQSFSFYDHQRTGQLMARATGDINLLGRFFNFAFRMIISSGLLLLLVLYSMITLNLKLTIVSGIILPFIFVSTRNYSSKIRPLWSDVREQNGVLTSVIQENLSGVRVIRGFSREDYELKKFRMEVQKFFDINMSIAKLRAFFMPLVNFISAFGVVLIIWYGGSQVINAALSIGGMVAFYFYLAKLMRPVRMIGFMTSMLIRTLAAAERVFEIIDAEVEVNDKEGAQTLRNTEGRISFEDVWFSYDEKNMVLKDIDLEIDAGQTIAILGATGSGKSSIINLIPRFYDVTKGSIKIDGMDIRDSTIKSLRRHIGIVRQDPFIFSTSLRKNIAYGVEDAKIEAVINAAKQAKIHEFIDSLPDGYNTKVGERGVTLSGGQKQRIAIARALLKNPKILILDDSTSSVDTQTEYEIQLALDELLENRTTFIITQRLSSIKKADYIVVLEDGKIAEKGQHEDLMDKQGIYYRLYKTQVSESQGGNF
jgi:ATP-binding cassette subfamily B protein